MKLFVVFLLFVAVSVTVSSESEGRGKREAIKSCKMDFECPPGQACVFGFCSSDDTKNTFEGLQKAKTRRARNKSKKIVKRTAINMCVDDSECQASEICNIGKCELIHRDP